MSSSSQWLAYLSHSDVKNHKRWLKRGCQGLGRIVLENANLRGATLVAPELVAAKFVKCDLTDTLIRFGDLSKAELIDCNWESALLERSIFNHAFIKDCQFLGAALNIADFIGTYIQGGDWSKTNLDRTDWTDAQVIIVCFHEANFQQARLNQSKLLGCNFTSADLEDIEAYGAVFEGCDFRGANFDGARIQNTVFKNCSFYNCHGMVFNYATQDSEKSQVIAPDLSESANGTGVVETIYDAESFFQQLNSNYLQSTKYSTKAFEEGAH
jgi:uncharacterized protein YjbI with pentapeptide repeats